MRWTDTYGKPVRRCGPPDVLACERLEDVPSAQKKQRPSAHRKETHQDTPTHSRRVALGCLSHFLTLRGLPPRCANITRSGRRSRRLTVAAIAPDAVRTSMSVRVTLLLVVMRYAGPPGACSVAPMMLLLSNTRLSDGRSCTSVDVDANDSASRTVEVELRG